VRVALVNEGTYPYVTGGVSTWCHQLVTGLPDVTWDLLSIVGVEPDRPAVHLPANVRSLTAVPVWGAPRPARLRAERAAARLCRGLLGDSPADVAIFGEALRQLAELAQPAQRRVARLPGRRSPASVPPTAPPALGRQKRAEAVPPQAPALGRQKRAEAVLPQPSARPAGASGPLRLLSNGRHPLGNAPLADILVDAWAYASAQGRSLPRLTLRDADEAANLIEHALRPLAASVPSDVDVVHANANGLSSMIALAAKWRSGVPFLMTEHGVYLRERYLSPGEQSPGVKTALLRFHRALARLAYVEADAITPVSGFNARWAVRHGADPRKVTVIGNGVDPERFTRFPDEPAEPVIAWVGRVDPLKDLETLIRALGVVHKRVPGAKLLLAGPVPTGNDQYAENCRNRAAELGLADDLIWGGPVPSSRDAFARGQVAVLSSISEGMPYTVLEAMMCGRATVSTDVGGVAEAVGDAGLIVPPRDPEALGRACADLLLDAQLRAELAARGRARALSQFTLRRCLSLYRRQYVDLAPRVPVGLAR
jgi:polysaccharide biosynthesis protein PelF